MVLADAVRSKLSSLLRPWLEEEPALELKLGFLSWTGCAKNLTLNPSALNLPIENSTNLLFKKVKIAELRVRISPWSYPSVIIEVRGLDVTLTPRESVGGRRENLRESAAKKRKEVIASLDPEGAYLHEIIERILVRPSSGNCLTTTLANVLLRCCQIQFQDTYVQLHFINESYGGLLKVNKFSLDTEFLGRSSVFGGLLGALILSRKESVLTISCGSVELGLKESDHVNWMTSLMGLSACIRLNNLHPLDYDIRVSHVHFKISPATIPVVLVLLDAISFKEFECYRNGKELWKIASERLGQRTLISKHSFYKVANMVLLWSRYVCSYESLLLVIGFSTEKTFKKNIAMVSSNNKLLTRIKHQLKDIYELEKKLPAEAVARGRRIARQGRYSHSLLPASEPINGSVTISLLKVFVFLLPLWNAICLIFELVVRAFLMWNILSVRQGINGSPTLGSRSKNLGSEIQFSLSLGEICITLSHSNTDHNAIYTNTRSGEKPSNLVSASFYFIIKCLCLTCILDITTESVFVAVGEVNLGASSEFLLIKSDLRSKKLPSYKGPKSETDDESKIVLWSNPAMLHHSSEENAAVPSSPVNNAFIFTLENSIQALQSEWKKISRKYGDMNVEHKEHPFALCQLENFLMDPSLESGNYGLWKCSLAVGKVCSVLDYSSILSTALIFRQIQHYYQWANRLGRMQSLPSPSDVSEEKSQIRWENIGELYNQRMKLLLLHIISDKNIQVGALIAGPNIQVSWRDELFDAIELDCGRTIDQGSSGYCFSFNLANIEFAVQPASRSVLSQSTAESTFDEASRKVDISKPHSNERFTSQGCVALDGYLRFNSVSVTVENSELDQRSQIVEPVSLTLLSSACRDYLHSLTGTVNSLSLTMSGMTTGAAVSLYVDELWAFFQIFEGLLSVILAADSSSESVGHGYPQDFIRKLLNSDWRNAQRNRVESEDIYETMMNKSTEILIEANLELESMDVILDDSRSRHITGTSTEPEWASSSASPHFRISPAWRNSTILENFDLPDFGVGLFIKKSCIQISHEGNLLGLVIDFSGIELVIFRNQSVLGVCTDVSRIKILPEESSERLCQFIISNCYLNLHFGFHGASLPSAIANNEIVDFVSGDCGYSITAEGTHIEGSSYQSYAPDHKFIADHLVTTMTPREALCCWLLVDIRLSEVFMSAYCTKNQLTGARQPDTLRVSIFICERHHTINCKIQGGYIFLETSSMAMFVNYSQMYLMLFTSHPLWILLSSREMFRKGGISAVYEESTAKQTHISSEENLMGSVSSASLSEMQEAFKWMFWNDLAVYISHFSFILAVKDEHGEVQELMVEADMSLKLWSSEVKLIFDLNRLSVYTEHLHNSKAYSRKDPQIPHFRPITVAASSSQMNSGNYNFPSQGTVIVPAGADILQSTEPSAFRRENSSETAASTSTHYGSAILKHLAASIVVKKMISRSEVGFVQLKSDVIGNGSISGFDLTISLSEIQMLSALFAPLSGIFSVKDRHSLEQKIGSPAEGQINDSYNTIPDGAIVVIKDLHEHMCFAVETLDSKYRVVGALHYSLVGERALFRVKYHRGWRPGGSWISFMSLFAKNDQGEPLRLNFCPGSGFVEISSSNDKQWALWKTFPYKLESYGDDDDVKYCNIYSKKAFHLINQKNNCAVAFVDGLPEFVKKPGNPFKVKVLNELTLTNDERLSIFNGYSSIICDTNVREDSSRVEGDISEPEGNLPHVNITIDKIVLTILHEVSGANDRVPLFRASINGICITGQMLSSKFRIISLFSVTLQYLDVRTNLWRDIVSPIDSALFFRFKYTHQKLGSIYQGVPAHFYFSMRQVDLSLTEVALDILLYLVGKLNIAGPYAVRNSLIFPNACKIENRSGLSLLCNFPYNQDMKIAGNSSVSILRHVAMVGQLPESASFLSICLGGHGLLSTSPINVSLSDACFFAWKTRITSIQDSRSFPGPFVVVEVSNKLEEELSVVVSPLLRICNESGFSMELRFRRPQEKAGESATLLMRSGDIVDDSIAVFDAVELSGASKRALLSLTLGNFLLSIKPEIVEYIEKNGKLLSAKWSEDLQGGKAIRLSGIFDKLNYRLRKAVGVESIKSFFSSLHCPLIVEGQHVSDLYFLVRTIARDVPVRQPPNVATTSEVGTSQIALQVQKEIFIYPTVQVHNLLQSEILILLTENHPDLCIAGDYNDIGKQAKVPCGSSAYLYANPAMIYFTVTLTAYSTRCKPVSSSDWLKKLNKQKSTVPCLDTELEFEGRKYYAFLRLSRAERGILEVTIFTPYTLQNSTEFSLLCSAANQKPHPRGQFGNYGSSLPPELGCLLPPRSAGSWFLKSSKVHIKLLEEKSSLSLLDLDVLSGFTELCLEVRDDSGINHIRKLGVSLLPCTHEVHVPSQVICIVPRYVIANESRESILVRQCCLQDDVDDITIVEGKQKVALQVRNKTSRRRETSILDSVLRKNKNANEDSQIFIQFRVKESELSWSGPICVASLGRFFLRFKRPLSNPAGQSNIATRKEKKPMQFAAVQIVEESSSFLLSFHMPANAALPYRIENCLRGTSVLYYQKDSAESDILGSGESVEYVWDDLSLPHKLVVHVTDLHLSRQINIDKMHSWKPFFKMRQHKGLALHLPLDNGYAIAKRTNESHGVDVFKVGYEVYVDGLTRVLRICVSADSYKEEKMLQPRINFQFRVSYFAMHVLEYNKQDPGSSELPIYSTIIVARFSGLTLDLLITDLYKSYYIRIQSFDVDEKWQGAPFASMIRRSQLRDLDSNENILHVTFILHSTNSKVKQVKYSCFILQPIDLKVDEETLMRLVPFWRTSLSESRTQSQQFYFKHLEIHPIKIIASFLPGSPYSSYNSAQETLRSLLHSVIKVPAVNNTVVELNGILLTHALVTFHELLIKCAQHYSWYLIRAVYIAKGSPLLPPTFASIFDDSASSSLDIFFDPSDGSINLPGLTLGTFKFISKCIGSKGFSGTKRYFGDLGKTIKTAGSNALFAAVTEISDSILKGAEASGFNGMINGFHQGILRLAMEPSLLGAAILEGGPDRKIKLDHSPGVDELYIEGYLQAMLDVMYKQEYLRVRVVDNQVVLKNLPPNSSIINEIVENVKSFLVSKALLKGDASTTSRPFRHLRAESEWRIGPTVLTLCEHLFVSFAIRMLRKQANRHFAGIKWKGEAEIRDKGMASSGESQEKPKRRWGVGKFVFSGMIAYLDGRLCRHIPNPIARRIVSGFLLSYLDKQDGE